MQHTNLNESRVIEYGESSTRSRTGDGATVTSQNRSGSHIHGLSVVRGRSSTPTIHSKPRAKLSGLISLHRASRDRRSPSAFTLGCCRTEGACTHAEGEGLVDETARCKRMVIFADIRVKCKAAFGQPPVGRNARYSRRTRGSRASKIDSLNTALSTSQFDGFCVPLACDSPIIRKVHGRKIIPFSGRYPRSGTGN